MPRLTTAVLYVHSILTDAPIERSKLNSVSIYHIEKKETGGGLAYEGYTKLDEGYSKLDALKLLYPPSLF